MDRSPKGKRGMLVFPRKSGKIGESEKITQKLVCIPENCPRRGKVRGIRIIPHSPPFRNPERAQREQWSPRIYRGQDRKLKSDIED